MKCQSCGSELHIEDERCPYCGNDNPHYKKHRLVMKKYQKDYETVKQNVYTKAGIFTGRNAKITVIAVLALLNIVMLMLYMNAWDIHYFFEKQAVKRNAAVHMEALSKLEAGQDYFALVAYYDEHNLSYGSYGAAVDEYWNVCAVSRSYYRVYKGLTELTQENEYTSMEKRIQNLCEDIEYMYQYSEPRDYDKQECFRREHVEAMEDMKENVKYLLIAYGNVTKEEAECFEQLSNAQKQIALERGVSGYEE